MFRQAYRLGQSRPLNLNFPPDVVPVLAGLTKAGRFRRFVTKVCSYTYRLNMRVLETEYNIARRHFSHELVESVSMSIGLAFG